MSGTRPSGSNVVPMNQAASPQGTMMSTPPMPNPMWWGGGAPLPGCAPGGAGLAECYWQVQAATAFISAIMIDAINNNPDVTQAIIDAIVKSGSNVPLIGVTDGSNAQPGQVGEWFLQFQNVSFTAAIGQVQYIQMGVLPPGDWNVWSWSYCASPVNGLNISLDPIPTGFSSGMQAFFLSPTTGSEQIVLNTPMVRASITVPTLLVMVVETNQSGAGSGAGTLQLWMQARRMR